MNVFPGLAGWQLFDVGSFNNGQPTSQSNALVKEGQRAESSCRAPSTSEAEIGTAFSRERRICGENCRRAGRISQSTVLEIGPGRGILTPCWRRTRRLIAVELDRVLAAQLRLKFSMARNVEIIEADILSIEFDSLFGPKPGLGRPGIDWKPEPVRVVGNLPYYITVGYFAAVV